MAEVVQNIEDIAVNKTDKNPSHQGADISSGGWETVNQEYQVALWFFSSVKNRRHDGHAAAWSGKASLWAASEWPYGWLSVANTFQIERTASAKALRQLWAWNVWRAVGRPVWLAASELYISVMLECFFFPSSSPHTPFYFCSDSLNFVIQTHNDSL